MCYRLFNYDIKHYILWYIMRNDVVNNSYICFIKHEAEKNY